MPPFASTTHVGLIQVLAPIGNSMRPSSRFYRFAFLAVSGLSLVSATLSLTRGHLIALVPICLNLAAIVTVALRRHWAYFVVWLWSLPSIFAGGAMWLAVLLRGGAFTQTATTVALRTALLLVGFFFAFYARSSLGMSANNSFKPNPLRGSA